MNEMSDLPMAPSTHVSVFDGSTQAHMLTYIHTYIHTHMHTYICIHTYIHAYIHTYINIILTYIYPYMHAFTHTQKNAKTEACESCMYTIMNGKKFSPHADPVWVYDLL
jgi:hypothetical protein